MDRTRSVVTGERFAQGMTFDEYVRYTATPENLAREAGWWLGRERKDQWSSDCRRDVPMLARLAEAGGLELRIFNRDGVKFGEGPTADPRESPNADIVNEFLREQDGQERRQH